MKFLIFTFVTLCVSFTVVAEDPFRTDEGDENLPWFQLVDGEFPPEGSAHYFSGELIQVDHLERKFILRVDRTDKQNRSHFDLPVAASMLPYGSISYHGSFASLRDIPLGTHLHGWFFVKDPDDKNPPIEGWHNRRSYEIDFTRCFRLEDDFTYFQKQQHLWRVDSVNLDEMKLTARLQAGDKSESPKIFDLVPSTRVWKGREVGTLEDIQSDQNVLFNMTWATLYGPGRITEIWLDEESRDLATSSQRKKHLQHIRERGIPGIVDAVDNQERIVSVVLFSIVDRELLDELKEGDTTAIAVARETLMTYDPVNDRKRGPLLSKNIIPVQPGSSGVQVQIRPDLLLEGYRPNRIVRLYPSGWKVIALPKEEEYFGR